MTETLSFIFQKTNGAPIEINGVIIRPSYKLNLQKGEHKFLIRRLKVKEKPLQGIRLKIKKGEIFVNDKTLSDVILWANTSPDLIEIHIKSKKDCELIIWNEWQIDNLTQAWVGNAGIHIVNGEKVTKLECSNGIGDVDFTDLVVEIEKVFENLK
jgi:hypothetical protein